MKITNVSFRSNLTVANYQHVHIEVSASVDAQEDPSAVLDSLKKFVAAELLRARDGETRPGRFIDSLEDRPKSLKNRPDDAAKTFGYGK